MLDDSTSTTLSVLSRAEQELARLEDVGDIKDIRDKAEAVRQYAKSAALGLDAQNDAAEVKLRAERRAGQILSTMRLRGGDRKSAQRKRGTSLADLGITQNQSTRWQLMSKLPEADFEDYLSRQRTQKNEILSSDIIRLANEYHGKPKPSDPERDRYSVISELENHRDLLESMLKPKSKYGPVELTPGEARNVQRLLKEMNTLLQDLKKMDASADATQQSESPTINRDS